MIRAAKESLNGIDPWDVKRSYRFEQGFTFELNLSGVADEHRDAFVDKRERHFQVDRASRSDVVDKRMTEEDVVAELRDGMTIGIGGWGSRRKPMCIVRAIAQLRREGPHRRELRRPRRRAAVRGGQGPQGVYAFCSLDSIALEPHFRAARQAGAIATLELDEGMFLLGLQAAAWRVPFLPDAGRARLRRPRPPTRDPTVASPYDDGEELVAVPALDLDVALVHMHRGDARGNGQFLGLDLYFDDLLLHGRADGAS